MPYDLEKIRQAWQRIGHTIDEAHVKRHMEMLKPYFHAELLQTVRKTLTETKNCWHDLNNTRTVTRLLVEVNQKDRANEQANMSAARLFDPRPPLPQNLNKNNGGPRTKPLRQKAPEVAQNGPGSSSDLFGVPVNGTHRAVHASRSHNTPKPRR